MFCYNCGKDIANAPFCAQCGTPAAAPQPRPMSTGDAVEDAMRYNIPVDRIVFLLDAFELIQKQHYQQIVIPNSRWRTPTIEQFRYCGDNGFEIVQIWGKNGWFVVPKK